MEMLKFNAIKKFGEYGVHFREHVFSFLYEVSCVDIVFDEYNSASLKSETRLM